MEEDEIAVQQSSLGVELQKLSIGDLFVGFKRLSLSSTLWLVGGLCAVAVAIWSVAVWYEQKFGSPSPLEASPAKEF